MSSNGATGLYQPYSGLMGVYLKTTQLNAAKPVYMLDRGGQFLYYDGLYWNIGNIISTELPGLTSPPGTGWIYEYNGGWYLDNQLTVLGETIVSINVDPVVT